MADDRISLDEDMRFQRATWIAERLGWIGIAMVVVVALSGLFSNGLLSDRVETSPDSTLTLSYARFQRLTALTRFAATAAEAGGDEIRLRLDRAFQENFDIESFQPRPIRSTANPAGIELVFERPSSGPLSVIIWARPLTFGLLRLSAAAGDGPALHFNVLVYP